MSIWTQGTELFALVPTQADPEVNEVLRIDCVTSLTPGGDPADQIEDTCLDATARSYIKGLKTPGQANITLNADPRNASHYRLYQLTKDGGTIKWAIGWSDGTEDPVVDGSGDDFDLPDTRSWYVFEGYVADFPFDFAANTVVTTAAVVQRSGEAEWILKVNEGPTEIILDPTDFSVAIAATQAISSSVLPASAVQAVTWESSDPLIATVDSFGVVTGVAVGTCVITAISAEDIDVTATANCTVTV